LPAAVVALIVMATAPVRAWGTSAVVISTDCGVEVDDQWALAHALLSIELDVRAIITTHAATVAMPSAATAQAAAQVVAQVLPAGTVSPPVIAGSTLPLQDTTTPRPGAAVDLLVRISQDFSESHRLLVLALGAGTDIASAILTDPSIVRRITIVAMAFDDWPDGGDGFNVRNDPASWEVILDSSVPLVVGTFAVTKPNLRLTRSEAAALVGSHGATGAYLNALYAGWLDRQPQLVTQFVAPDTWVVFDEVVVAYALGLARGQQVPRPRLQHDLSFAHPETTSRITWLTDIDTNDVWRDLTAKIDARARR
jgi:inosine-uridine nucleoside N-ribohydrolase